jgi:hypothetical protein
MNRMKKITSLLLFIILINSKTIAQQAENDIKINITEFSVSFKDQKIMVEWATDGLFSTNYWEIQESGDGLNFSTVALVLGPDPKQKGDHYQFINNMKATKSTKFSYRLKHISLGGEEIFSQIIHMTK